MKANVPATFAIVQDCYGYIWFGTIDGLFRYDGSNHKIFRSDSGEYSLSSNTIRALAVDSQYLWIGTQGGGLNRMELTSGKIKHYFAKNNRSNSISNNSIWALFIDKKKNLWIGMEDNMLNRLNLKTNKITKFDFIEKSKNIVVKTSIRTIYQDSKGNIWIGTDRKGIFVLNPNTAKVIHYIHNEKEKNSLLNNACLQISEDNKGSILIASSGGGLFKKNSDKKGFKAIVPNNIFQRCYSIIIDESQIYWVGTDYGLFIYNPLNKTTRHLTNDNFKYESLIDNRIRFIYKNTKNISWIGSEGGVDKIDLQKKFKSYQFNPKKKNCISKGVVRAIYQDKKGILWIGMTQSGFVSYDTKKHLFTNWTQKAKQLDTEKSFHPSRIFEDSQENLWFGDWNKGLFLFDREKHLFKNIINTSINPKFTDNRIQAILERDTNELWIATETGINIYNHKTKELRTIISEPSKPNSISGNAIQSEAFLFDKDSNLWIGTWSKGLNHIIFENGNTNKYTIQKYRFDEKKKNHLSSDNVISLYLQDDSLLWIGTFGGGLNCLNINKNTISSYTISDGLPNNVIFAIKEDEKHNLWLATDYGISHFHTKTHTFHNYDENDGLQDNHFYWGAAFKASNGELFFGGIKGLNSFYPNKIKLDSSKYPMYISQIELDSKPLKKKLFYSSDSIIIPPQVQDIKIHFAYLDYSNPKKYHYKVYLKGIDKKWIDKKNTTYAYYSNLKPGKYDFSIQVSNADGYRFTKENILHIVVKAPWYKTKLAYSIYLIFILLFVYLVNTIRTYSLEKSNKKLQEMVGIRTSEIERQKEELSNTLQKLSSAQKQLVETEKLVSLGTLVAGIAHEINNPINYINSSWQIISEILDSLILFVQKCNKLDFKSPIDISNELLIEAEKIDFEFIQNNLPTVKSSITSGIKKTIDIVKSLNSYAHFRKGEQTHYKFSEAIHNALVILKSKYKDRIKIHFDTTNFPSIICNPGLINQLFMNLTTNAIDAIPKDGNIWIEAQKNNENIEIRIKDDGIGIKKENLDKIFDPFFTTKDVGKGTGLGLYISYQIVSSHGGSIHFYSIPDKGTTVTLKFPLSPKA